MADTWNPQKDMPDLEGKVAVVTGTNSGIGLQTIKHLATKGAKVYYTTRSESKAAHVRKFIHENCPDVAPGNLIWIPLDLSSVQSVLTATEKIRSMEDKVDILINNAGITTPRELETTDAGWEISMAVCYLGHFIFTDGLFPLLKKAASDPKADVRIITMSSNSQTAILPKNYQLDFSDPNILRGVLPYVPWSWRYFLTNLFHVDMFRYGVTKLATVLHAQELQRRLDQQGLPILSICVHPGGVLTDEVLDIFIRPMRPVMAQIMITDDEGSYTSLFAATERRVRQHPDVYKGKYLIPFGKVAPAHPLANNPAQGKALWDTTTEELNAYFRRQGLNALISI